MKTAPPADRLRGRLAALFLPVFCAAVLAAAFDRHYPAAALSGEGSAATWLSGFLLSSCAAFCLALAARRGLSPWLPLALFFAALALDERFMFHERLKERILYSARLPQSLPGIAGEAPVMLAALAGAAVAFSLRGSLRPRNRVFLALAAASGTLSVVLDVAGRMMALEDGCKLLGELFIARALLGEVDDG